MNKVNWQEWGLPDLVCYPWQDIHLFNGIYTDRSPTMKAYAPLPPTPIVADPLGAVAPELEVVTLFRHEYRWGKYYAYVYWDVRDKRPVRALALFSLATRLIE